MKSLLRGLKWFASAKTSASAIAYSLASRIGVLVLNLATGIIMARTLGPEGRGAASAIALWPLVISGVITLGIPVALKFNVRRKADDAAELFSVALLMSSSLGLIAVAIGVIFIPRWLGHYSPDIIRFAQIMMLFAPMMTVNLLLQAYLEAKGDFAQSSSMLYFPPVGTLISLLVLFKLKAITVFTVPVAYEAPYACITFATLYRLRKSIRMPKRILTRGKLLLHFGSRAYGLDILNTLSAQIGQVLVVGLLSAESFGLYAVAINVSRVLYVLGMSLNTVLFPKAAERSPEEAVKLVSRAARFVFAANTVAGGLLILAMPVLIRVAYGTAYAADIQLARVLTVEVILGATVSTLAQSFMSTGRPGLATILQTIGLCATFPLMLVLIPRFGLMGAAFALLSSTALRLMLVLASYPIFLQFKIPSLLPNEQDVREIRARLRRAPT